MKVATGQPRELVDDLSGSEDSASARDNAVTSNEQERAASKKPEEKVDASFSPLTPESVPQSPEAGKHETETEAYLITAPSKRQIADTDSSKARSSTLSASAKPFEFNPRVSGFSPGQTMKSSATSNSNGPASLQTRSDSGLEASRHAAPGAGLESSRYAVSSADLGHSKAVNESGLDSSRYSTQPLISPSDSQSPPAKDSIDDRIASGVHYIKAPSPSFQEIDDVIQQLNEDSDVGVERNANEAWQSPAPSGGSRKLSNPGQKPELASTGSASSSDPFLQTIRPQRIASVSPNRLREPFQYLPKQESESSDKANTTNAMAKMVQRNARFSPSFKRPRNPVKELDSPVRRFGRADNRSISEWDDVVSSDEEIGFRARTGFFDNRVHELLGNIVDHRLRPLEQSLKTINATLVGMTGPSATRRTRRSTSAEVEKSDADDEDDDNVSRGAYSPIRDRRLERLKVSLLESMRNDQISREDDNSKVAAELLELRRSLSELKHAPQPGLPEEHKTRHDQLLDAVKALGNSISVQPSLPPNDASSSAQNDVLRAITDLKETLKTGSHRSSPSISNGDVSKLVEEAMRKQSRGKSAPVMSSQEAATADRLKLQVDGLESMLRNAEARADDELKFRQKLEAEMQETQKQLVSTRAEAAQHRESAAETEDSLRSILDGQQQTKQQCAALQEVNDALEKSMSELTEENVALKDTLEEYRISHDKWNSEMDASHTENGNLERTIQSLKLELEDGIESKNELKKKLTQIQEEMVATTRTLTEDQAAWRQKVEELKAKHEYQSARLEAEARTRERLELEIDRLEKQEKEATKARFLIDHVKAENDHLIASMDEVRTQNHHQQEKILGIERELHDTKESNQLESQRAFTSHKAELARADQEAHLTRANLEAVIARLEGQIEYFKDDISSNKRRHELMLEEASTSKYNALQVAAEAREAALQEHYRFHERTLEETRASHERALEELNASHQQAVSTMAADHDRTLMHTIEDKDRLHLSLHEEKRLAESTLNERLTLANEKTSHYQDHIAHLEARLEIAQSAAQAAAAAAKSPGSQVTFPSAGSGGSARTASTSTVPEKISPQALRESILVLQEQLRDRENQIERLESELGKVDGNAPKKIKDRDLEISWLRELLGVRLDDLQEIVDALATPGFDRENIRNAAIRLRANIEMEQQEKERAMTGGGGVLPSLASLTASPRAALPMAAAAAWGSFRKARASMSGGPAEMAAPDVADQTPLRSSPQSFLSGLLTPPNTQARSVSGRTRSSLCPGARGATSGPSRPRGYATPPRQLSAAARSASGRVPTTSQVVPESPTLLRSASYDRDAESTHYSLDHYVSSATEGEVAVGLDDADIESETGETRDDEQAASEEQLFGPSIELES